MELRKILASEYIQICRPSFSKLAVYYTRILSRDNYDAFVSVEAGNVLGIVFTESFAQDRSSIKYIFVKAEFRNKGIAQRLLQYVLSKFWDDNIPYICMEFTTETAQPMEHIAKKIGFYVYKESVSVVNHNNVRNRAVFKEYMDLSGHKLERFMLRRNFTIKSFAAATEQELADIKRNIGIGYPKYLDPFNMKYQRIDQGSFLVLKNNNVVGYLALGNIDGDQGLVEISCRACLSEYQNTGVGIWILLSALEYVASYTNIKKVIFNIDAKDTKLTNMLGKVPVSFPDSMEQRLIALEIYKDSVKGYDYEI